MTLILVARFTNVIPEPLPCLVLNRWREYMQDNFFHETKFIFENSILKSRKNVFPGNFQHQLLLLSLLILYICSLLRKPINFYRNYDFFSFLTDFNLLHPVIAYLYPLKTSNTFRFSDVFKGCRQAKPGCNGLKSVKNEKKS